MSASKGGKAPYAVGYGRPPQHTKYTKGQSGNPSGRRKGQPSVMDLMLREAGRFVKVKSGDGVERVTKHEVVVRQLWKAAMQGELPAIRMLLMFMSAPLDHSGDNEQQSDDIMLSLPARPDDEAVRRMLARFAHLQSDDDERR